MTLTKLVIHDLRNIEACDLSLSSGFNFLLGANGSGKTSILEAIYYLGHGRSFRSNLVSRVVRHQQNSFTVHARLQDSVHLLPVGVRKFRDGTTEVKIGEQKGQKLVQLAEILPMQLITPEGFELLMGGPKYRRAFVDWGVFHVEPQFYLAWQRVKRISKQRNAMLKTARAYKDIAIWDAELAKLVEQIDIWRQQYIALLVKRAVVLCEAFLPEFTIKFNYLRGWDKKMDYANYLQENFERDLQFGYTTGGIHKADLQLRVEGIPVEDALSRGQLKLLVCALRLAQGQQLSEDKGKQCVYLVDDFASELDSQRRALLAEQLKITKAQVFVSAINLEQVEDMVTENSKMFHVEHGKITPK